MDTKVCSICKIEKSVDNFHKCKRNGYRSQCKPCKSEYDKIWRESNKEKDLESKRKWVKSNLEYFHNYYLENKENISEYNKEYYLKHNEEIIENGKKYYKNNKKFIIERTKVYYNKIKTTYLFLYKKREYMKIHRKQKPYLFAHRDILQRHLKYTGNKKTTKTSIMLGYNSLELKSHLESLFTEGMCWNNYGLWHIDHIKPISKFNKMELPSVVGSLDNLQPLWAFENLSKGNKYE